MTFNQTTTYTPKHARDVEYVGKRRKDVPLSTLVEPHYRPRHCAGSFGPRAARDLGCQHGHPRTLAEQLAHMTPEQRRAFHELTAQQIDQLRRLGASVYPMADQ